MNQINTIRKRALIVDGCNGAIANHTSAFCAGDTRQQMTVCAARHRWDSSSRQCVTAVCMVEPRMITTTCGTRCIGIECTRCSELTHMIIHKYANTNLLLGTMRLVQTRLNALAHSTLRYTLSSYSPDHISSHAEQQLKHSDSVNPTECKLPPQSTAGCARRMT